MENYHKVKCGAVIISCCWTELLWWFNNEQQETNIKLLRLHNLHNLSVLSLHTFSFQDSSSCFSLFHWRFIHVSLSATFPASRVSQSNLNIDEPNVGQLAINPHSKDWTNYSAAVINTQPLHGCCRFCATDLLASSALSGIPSTSSGCSGGADTDASVWSSARRLEAERHRITETKAAQRKHVQYEYEDTGQRVPAVLHQGTWWNHVMWPRASRPGFSCCWVRDIRTDTSKTSTLSSHIFSNIMKL